MSLYERARSILSHISATLHLIDIERIVLIARANIRRLYSLCRCDIVVARRHTLSHL